MAGLLAGALERQGWRVTIVWPPGDPPRLPYRVGLGSLWLSRAAAQAARSVGPVNLIVTNGYLGAGFPRHTPRVHVYHGTMVCDSLSLRGSLPWREIGRRVVGGGLSEALSARGATVVCVSDSAAEEVRRYYRVNTDAVVPNAVDTAVFRATPRLEARASLGLPADGRLALFAGRLDHRKGAHLLFPAARRARYELVIAGSGVMAGARCLGVLKPAELALAYSAADCVLLPSSYEACSFVVLEALACGAPLITTRVGWIRNLLREHPDYDGLCVRRDEAEIADRLTRLGELATPELVSRVRAWVAENHNLERYASRWAALLNSL